MTKEIIKNSTFENGHIKFKELFEDDEKSLKIGDKYSSKILRKTLEIEVVSITEITDKYNTHSIVFKGLKGGRYRAFRRKNGYLSPIFSAGKNYDPKNLIKITDNYEDAKEKYFKFWKQKSIKQIKLELKSWENYMQKHGKAYNWHGINMTPPGCLGDGDKVRFLREILEYCPAEDEQCEYCDCWKQTRANCS